MSEPTEVPRETTVGRTGVGRPAEDGWEVRESHEGFNVERGTLLGGDWTVAARAIDSYELATFIETALNEGRVHA